LVHGEVRGGKYHEGRIEGLAIGGSSLCIVEGLVFWVSQQQYASGGGNIGEVQSLTFQDENSRSGLSWLCLALSLLMALF
jgi:hypothetical protein